MFDRLGGDRAENVTSGLVVGIPAIAGGVAWMWFSLQQGNDPPVWAYVILGIGAVGLSMTVVGLFGTTSDNVQGFLTILLVAVIVGGGWLWARTQVGPVAGALASACEGSAAPEAGAYAIGQDGPFHLVVLNENGDKSRFTGVDADWRADSVEDAELVACVEDRKVLIETCSYMGGSDVERFRNALRVRVRAARTGEEVGTFRLVENPRACHQSEQADLTKLEGEVTFEMLSERLAAFSRGELPRP